MVDNVFVIALLSNQKEILTSLSKFQFHNIVDFSLKMTSRFHRQRLITVSYIYL